MNENTSGNFYGNSPTSNPVVHRRTALDKFGRLSRVLFGSKYKDLWSCILPYLTDLRYFSAPASSKFHLCVDGGLLLHSVQVTELAITLTAEKFPCLEPEKVILAGLLHDVGKCGLLTKDGLQVRYVKNPEPFPSYVKSQKYWGPYVYTKSKPEFTIRDLSALYCAQWGLPWDVVEAILAHDGLWDDANKPYLKDGASPLLLVLMSADYMSAQGLETKAHALEQRCA